MTSDRGGARADVIAARFTGVGFGLVAFMLAWTVGARVTDRVWGPPSGAFAAMGVALLIGAVTAFAAGRRLVAGLQPARTVDS